MKKFLALLLAAVMCLGLFACTPQASDPSAPPAGSSDPSAPVESEGPTEPEYTGVGLLAGKEYGVDYTDLYTQFGKQITIADVIEDTDTGLSYIEVDGQQYELGMDFLSMCMVYNTAIPEGREADWPTEDDVYANWWKLYIQRWNSLLPEIPLYSNEYYDLYNAQIKGVAEYPTNPYWSAEQALIDWTSEKADNSIFIGDTTELSGKIRYANFGSTNPGAADLAVQNMCVGMETVSSTKEGGFVWNDSVVAEHSDVVNEDGSKTFTIKIKEGLKFSDGSDVTSKDYLAFAMAFSTPVAAEAAGKDHQFLRPLVGFDDFNAYTGPGSEKGTKEIKGLRLIDDHTFSVTIDAKHLPYFYDITYGAFSAYAAKQWIGDAQILDDGNGCYFSDDFYAKDGDDKYVTAAHIYATSQNTDNTYPYSGPYMLESYDVADKSAVLKLNPNFPGNYEGVKPTIETVVYKYVVTKTQLTDLQTGGVDVLKSITGGDATNEALALVEKEPDNYVATHYSRAGYGKLGFRADFGPVQFVEVRRAIAYCIDRAGFAKDFTGGFGGVSDGPYYTGSWMYKHAVEHGMILDAYATSVDSAIAVLEEGGWIYDAEGNPYESGVRYKKIAAEHMDERDITFQSKDGAYKTTKVGDDYYMPLVLNWYGTADNDFSDLLVTGFMQSENMTNAGFVVQNTLGDFNPMLDEMYQAPVTGSYQGPPMYTCFNFATGFTSAAYDYAYNWTVDPGNFLDYSICYLKDLADVYWLK